jgi:hypothetical protein
VFIRLRSADMKFSRQWLQGVLSFRLHGVLSPENSNILALYRCLKCHDLTTYERGQIPVLLCNFIKISVALIHNIKVSVIFLAYFPYLQKIKVGLCDHHAVCMSVYSHHHQLLLAEIFFQLGI